MNIIVLSVRTCRFSDRLTNEWIDWLIGWLIDWLVGWLVGWLGGWLVSTEWNDQLWDGCRSLASLYLQILLLFLLLLSLSYHHQHHHHFRWSWFVHISTTVNQLVNLHDTLTESLTDWSADTRSCLVQMQTSVFLNFVIWQWTVRGISGDAVAVAKYSWN